MTSSTRFVAALDDSAIAQCAYTRRAEQLLPPLRRCEQESGEYNVHLHQKDLPLRRCEQESGEYNIHLHQIDLDLDLDRVIEWWRVGLE